MALQRGAGAIVLSADIDIRRVPRLAVNLERLEVRNTPAYIAFESGERRNVWTTSAEPALALTRLFFLLCRDNVESPQEGFDALVAAEREALSR